MSSPIVQVLFQGRLLQCIPFEGEELRIGRRKDNDIVISNLSVSRRHAKLVRDEGSIFLHDAGSENGCFLNGARVEKTKKVEVGPDDELVIGKHRILIQWEEAASAPSPDDSQEDLAQTRAIPVPVPEEVSSSPSDQWKAAVDQALAPSAPEPAGVEPFEGEFEIAIDEDADEFEVSLASEDPAPGDVGADVPSVDESIAPPEIETPSVSEFFESSEEPASPEPVHVPEPASDESPQPAATEVEAANPDESGLFGSDPVKGPGAQAPKQAHSNPEIDLREFDFDLESAKPPKREPSPTVAMPMAVPDGSETQGRPVALPEGNLNETQVVPQFPMLSIRNGEDAVRTVRWESARLEVGRSSDCDIVLADPRVSRKHAEFEADAEGYRVRDLESINFTFVNGEKITDRTLAPGDVVRIENFEISFEMNGLADTNLQPEPEAAVNRSTNSMTMIKPLAREFDGPSAPLGEFESDAAALTDPGGDLSSDELALGGELESQLDSLSQGSFEDAEAAPRDLLSEVEAELELEMEDDDDAGELFAPPYSGGEEVAAGVEDSPTVPPIEPEAGNRSDIAEVEESSFVTEEPAGPEAEEAGLMTTQAEVAVSPEEMPGLAEVAVSPAETPGLAEVELSPAETPGVEIEAAATPQEVATEDLTEFEERVSPEVGVDALEAQANDPADSEAQAASDILVDGPAAKFSESEDPDPDEAEAISGQPGFDAEAVLPPTDDHAPSDDDTNAELLLASVVGEADDEIESENVLSDPPEADSLAAAIIEAADSIPDLAEAPAEEDAPFSLETEEGGVDELFEAPGQVTELAEEDDAPSIALEEPVGAQTQLYDPLEHPDELSGVEGMDNEDGALPPSALAEIEDATEDHEGADSLFDAGIDEAQRELDEEKPLEESPVGGSSDMASAVSFRADASQASMPTGKLSIEFALKVEDLSEPVRAILRESREKGMVLPIEIRVKVED